MMSKYAVLWALEVDPVSGGFDTLMHKVAVYGVAVVGIVAPLVALWFGLRMLLRGAGR